MFDDCAGLALRSVALAPCARAGHFTGERNHRGSCGE
jgi:hypothetical protein